MIDFQKYYDLILHFLASNLLITLALCVILLFFLYKKTEETVKFLAFCVLLVTVIYVMSLLSESGSFGEINKKEMTQKSENMIKNSPK